ncbi:hypothetical protein L198_06424 [Cryptococcus wingfieldii CBS 7118]|uniref:Uncharacterized protein n=1 Tax=Cryptococcus wingfieldii CBS 7118 TaxID=1295528 RepID=A0A1E3IMA2_9TREE|nr:hypothetical protein L198_06424 [Cryptococcus wingfieldii CBS 7118]ODN89730.1 hypothetical protein L198_06424 [Cryptococcus wingfieldii CBS 7118]
MTLALVVFRLLLSAMVVMAASIPNVGKRYISDVLSEGYRNLFDDSMKILDNNFALPFLWKSPKLSSWYAVGLLARNEGDDVEIANKLIHNIVTKQYTDPSFVAYGTFLGDYHGPYADGESLWEPKIYGSYDPNNALFVTIAGIIIDHDFASLLEPEVLANLRKAMYMAVVGDGYRVGGESGDNLYPGYSNPWYMRCVSAAYLGHMYDDANMTYWAENWAQEAVDLFNQYNTLAEFNSATYEGVTLFALSLAQYAPDNSTIYKEAPRLLEAIWDQISETYNPSLNTLSGPWDRTYGFDMTQYYSVLGSAITGITGKQKSDPMPNPLDGANHYTDMAMMPMQAYTSPYIMSHISSSAKSRFSSLYAPHSYTAQSISPPWDKRARNYTFWLEKGLSVGGMTFDEKEVGGPSLNQPSFSPGVIMWDAGKTGTGAGWISYYPTNPACEILASSTNLTIRYPPTQDWPNGTTSSSIQLLIADPRINEALSNILEGSDEKDIGFGKEASAYISAVYQRP